MTANKLGVILYIFLFLNYHLNRFSTAGHIFRQSKPVHVVTSWMWFSDSLVDILIQEALHLSIEKEVATLSLTEKLAREISQKIR